MVMVFAPGLIGRLAKGAIATKIPAEIRQRDKNLRGKSHDTAFMLITQLSRSSEQSLQPIALRFG